MIYLSEWARRTNPGGSPWLILGKGPSFDRRRVAEQKHYRTASLNHVVRECAVDVAHFIDLDALTACADAVERNAQWLMMPRYLHVDFKPSRRPLEDFCSEVPVLDRMSRAGRLVCYHHDLAPWEHPDLPAPPEGEPLLRVRAFSSEAVVAVLGWCGVRIVRTLGIDGATSYSETFADLHDVTRLANGRPSFDAQFVNIHQLASENAMDYGPLENPIRVYVGTDDSQMVAVKVLEYSIRKFATRPVEVVPMLNLPVPMPKDPHNRPRTGFSFSRLLIPSLAGFRGRGIYLDADMLVFGDIAEIWDLPMNDCRVHCSRQDVPPPQWRDNKHFQPGRQMSVMLLDCARLDWDINKIVRGLDEGQYNYERLMFDLCIVPSNEIGEGIPSVWNSLEHFEPGKTRLLHYTDMGMQPWRFSHNPQRGIWRAFYREAVEAGAVDPAMVEAAIAAEHILPDMRHELQFAPTSTTKPRSPASVTDGVASERQRAVQLEAMALRAEVDMLRREMATLEARGHEREAEANRHQERCAELGREVNSLRNQLDSIRASLSWRVGLAATKPIRMARGLLKRSA